MYENAGGILCRRITELRKGSGMTQEQLADRLGITFQAVSKWETGQSCPDVGAIPALADIFGVTVDSLFGREQRAALAGLPWPDDGALRAVVFRGTAPVAGPETKPAGAEWDFASKIVFEYKGEALNVQSHFSVSCGDVAGYVEAGDGVNCGGVGGYVEAGDGVNCGNIGGYLEAGDGVNCGNVGGYVEAGDAVNCGNVSGNVSAGDGVSCGNVGKNVDAGDSVECGDVGGDVHAGDSVTAKVVKGNVTAEEVHIEQ